MFGTDSEGWIEKAFNVCVIPLYAISTCIIIIIRPSALRGLFVRHSHSCIEADKYRLSMHINQYVLNVRLVDTWTGVARITGEANTHCAVYDTRLQTERR
jgi:hypothetical protein